MSRDNNPRDILLRPVVSEKSYGLLDEGKYTFVVAPDANKTQIRLAVEAVFGVKVTGVNTAEPAGQAQAHPVRLGAAAGHQAGDRDPRRGRQDRHIRRLSPLRETRPDMAIRKYKPTTPGRRGASGSDFSEITRDEPEKSLVRPLHSQGGRNVLRPRHHPAPGRRPQAGLPADRLPAGGQGRRAGQGRAHRVRPEPYRPDRAAALRGRREALHHLPAGLVGGRPGGERPRGGHQAG